MSNSEANLLRFDMADELEEFENWKHILANSLLKVVSDAEETAKWAPEGEDLSLFVKTSIYCQQKADALWPDHSWPELPPNVIPISHAKRRT